MSSSISVSAGHPADTGATLGIDVGTSAVKALLLEGDLVRGGPAPCRFLPYPSSERTPHNHTAVRGAFLDLAAGRIDDASHGRALGAARLAQAALTGVSQFPRPRAARVFEPRPALVRRHDEAHAAWPQLHSLVRRVPGSPSTSDSLP